MNVPIASQNINFPGYGMFWLANSISSTLLGMNNRRLQEQAQQRNQAFLQEMERARSITEDEKMREDIAFKRRLMAVSREYRQETTAASFKAQLQAIELKYYLKYCWPLDPLLPETILKEISKGDKVSPQLNVILMRSPLPKMVTYSSEAGRQDTAIYNGLEYAICKSDIPLIGGEDKDVFFRKDACQRVDFTGSNVCVMNIHFLMSQIPTLVISPVYRDGRVFMSGAVWEPQAARPLIRPLFDFEFNPSLAEKKEDYCRKMIEMLHAATSIIIGSVRDSYMLLTQGKAPTLPALLNDKEHKQMKQLVMGETSVKEFIRQENNNILEALDEKNMPRLLDVFNNEDVESIKAKVKENEL